MALFIPDADCVSVPPVVKDGSTATENAAADPATICTGTLLQVIGSPFTGFDRCFRRGIEVNGHGDVGGAIESAVKVGEVDRAVLFSKCAGDKVKPREDTPTARFLEVHGRSLPAPGVTKRPWIAVRYSHSLSIMA